MNEENFAFRLRFAMKGRDEVEHKNDDMPCNVYLIVYKVYKKKYFPLMKFDCGT